MPSAPPFPPSSGAARGPDPAEAPSLDSILATVARLSTAQHALLRRISAHSTPVTVSELAAESGLHVSSVRETLDSLLDLRLVSRERLPARGRGRPSQGYLTYTPADAAFPARMATQVMHAMFDWLRDAAPDPTAAARQIGRRWGADALAATHVPDHSGFTVAAPGFSLVDHMDKIRLFLTAHGFAATADPEADTGLVLHACPFTSPEDPDPLALELRRGMVEGVLERTAGDAVTAEYLPDGDHPVIARVRLALRDGAARA